jgi:RNA polymerase sigma factor (sigma-70 family)
MSALNQPQAEVSLDSFLRQVRPGLKSLFAYYRIPPQDTEDLLQQALLALVYRLQSVQDPQAWLFGTVRNKCLLYWRERRRKVYDSVDTTILEGIAPPVAPLQERAELRHDLDNALEHLPQRCRSLLSLRYREGYEAPEVAERLGYSRASISKITTRCLSALTRYMVLGGARRKADD